MSEEKNILDRVLGGLGYKKKETKVELAQKSTADGETILDSENFAVGDAVFIVTEDGNIPLPEGEYSLEDGTSIEVDESGIIKETEKSDSPKEEVEVEVEAEAEAPTETQQPKKIIESMVKETQFEETKKEEKMGKPALLEKVEEKMGADEEVAEKMAEAIMEIVEDEKVSEMIQEYKEYKDKDKTNMSSDELKSIKAQLSKLQEENNELRNRLSDEGERTRFNPEAGNENKQQFKIGAKRQETLTDRVFNQLFN
jgi:hypothetical protein